jgi:hypothetical protein
MINTLRFHKSTHTKRLRELPKDIWLGIKYSYQRAKYGYCDYDMFSFDGSLSQYIIHGLEWLKENHSGMSLTFYPKHTKPGDDLSDEDDKYAHDQMCEVYDDIIKGFQNYLDGVDNNNYETIHLKESFKLLEEYYQTMWD